MLTPGIWRNISAVIYSPSPLIPHQLQVQPRKLSGKKFKNQIEIINMVIQIRFRREI